jgi:hypothetical protein
MRAGSLAALAAALACGKSDPPAPRQTAQGTLPAPSASSPPPLPSPGKSDLAPAPVPVRDPAADAERAELEALARPFIAPDTDAAIYARGALGPAPGTILVVTFRAEERGLFFGFALVPDRGAEHGLARLPLPDLPGGSASGEMRVAALTDLDGDPALEAVVALEVIRGAEGDEHGGHTYDATELIALDWDAKRGRFVRLPAVEERLAAAFPAGSAPPGEADIRRAVGR